MNHNTQRMILFALQIRQKRIFLGQLSKEVQFLEVTLNNELKFHNHVSNIYLKANRKLSALLKTTEFTTLDKRRPLFRGFTKR